MKDNGNIYIPSKATIREIARLTPDVNLYTLKTSERYNYTPGQFFMVSLFGAGEVPISVASAEKEDLTFCIRNVGSVTSAIHALKVGDRMGLRGPYGNGFSLDPAKDRDIVVMAGGLGIIPLRSVIHELIAQRKRYGKVFVLYGSKLPRDMLFRDEAQKWEEAGINVVHTVDCSEDDWKGCVGLVTAHMDKVDIDFSEAIGYVCGPEIMIRNSMKELSAKGMPDDRIFTSLEAHMKCGVGKCGHCYKGAAYVCTTGPVFSLKDLKSIEANSEQA